MNIRKLVALSIYTLRNKYKLPQEEFSKKLNIDIIRGHISRIENGNNIHLLSLQNMYVVHFTFPMIGCLAMNLIPVIIKYLLMMS